MKYQSSRKWKKLAAVLSGVLFVAVAVIAVYACYMVKLRDCRIEELSFELKGYKKELYVAARDLHKGELLTPENVRLERRYSDTPKEFYISEEDFGKALIADMKEGECLLRSGVSEVTENFRQVEIDEIEMSGHLMTGNRVDIRIAFGNAEDYIVLSEKLLVSYDEKKGIVLEMSEEEILTLSSAILDCRMYEDTRLYMVKYPEYRPMLQSRTNYVARRESLQMLGKQEETEERIRLEERLEGLLRR